ncbi:MAG: DUF308 domain-containing protein [Lachnospiraceae bacterium]|nr:DUF308 domain-containing protein [Lachnospiraceae bacterium]
MTIFQRIRSVIIALVMILSGVLMLCLPDIGYAVAALILSISLLLYGIRTLIYYFTLARHMVGGRGILYIGIVVLDLGIFTLTVADNMEIYILLYLLAFRLFSGLVDILRALEARRYESPGWKSKLAVGIVNILMALLALAAGIVFRSEELLVVLYCAGLFGSALARIATAFRKSAIVYIQ